MEWGRLLRRRVALITGAASGIGRATAQLFGEHGARVVAVDVDDIGGHQTVENIRSNSGDSIFVRADVGRMDEVKQAVQVSLDHYGQLDVVHSNAAAYAVGSATEISEAEWECTLDVCLKATWMLAKCAMPALLRQNKGAFIITGSVHSVRGYARHAAYQAAKGGLVALTRSLAADYAPQIRVNAILPGAIVTGLWDGVGESERERIAQMCPLRRNAVPEEVASVALFLASEMSSYMTGTCLVVDGGLTSVIKTD